LKYFEKKAASTNENLRFSSVCPYPPGCFKMPLCFAVRKNSPKINAPKAL
jgi:hypothetical protein